MPIVFCLLSSFFSCTVPHVEKAQTTNSSTIQSSSKDLKTISVKQLFEITHSDEPIIIDVRTKTEFASGHIPSAENIPMSELNNRIDVFQNVKNQEIFLVCAVGGRSGQAQEQLLKLGISTTNVIGGTKEWKSLGYPISVPK